MIPEYKRFQGAVLAEIIDQTAGPVSIEEWPEKGRLSSYVLNERVGLHVKHCGARMRPWLFTFTKSNFDELARLKSRCDLVFVVLVCWLDGMVCLTHDEFLSVTPQEAERAWIRAERRKREWYTVSGPMQSLPSRKPNGVECLLEVLGAITPQQRKFEQPRTSFFSLKRYLKKWSEGIFGSA